MDYNDWLYQKLVLAETELGYAQDFLDIHIFDDRDFEKDSGKYVIKDNTLVVVVKTLVATISYNVLTQPKLIYALSTNNDNIAVPSILTQFSKDNNFLSEEETLSDGTKDVNVHSYSTVGVLSNFNYVGTGYRSAYYLSGTIETIKNPANLDSLTFEDGGLTLDLKPICISFTLDYASSVNTEQIGTKEIATSVFQSATCSFSLGIPCCKNILVSKVIRQMQGRENGNTGYNFAFSIADNSFDYTGDNRVLLRQCKFVKNAGDAPTIAMGFSK